MSPETVAREEELLGSAGRLRILTALAAGGRQEFVQLRGKTGLTDGNLATHTRRLESAGFVAVDKSFRDRKPVTQVMLTTAGRAALERHVEQLVSALRPPVQEAAGVPERSLGGRHNDDDWVD